jgi:hypothetical protein
MDTSGFLPVRIEPITAISPFRAFDTLRGGIISLIGQEGKA